MTSVAGSGMRASLHLAVVLAALSALAACGGGGGGGGSSSGGNSASVTISGKITFDRVPFKAALGAGLDFAGAIRSPARDVVVEAVQTSNVLGGQTIVASGTTNASGDYSLSVPANTTLFIRAKAQMLKNGPGPSWNFSVMNNTDVMSNATNDVLYALDGSPASSGTANQVRDLHAPSGWNLSTSTYAGTRSAAPFAILDTIYQVRQLIQSAKPDASFPPLKLFWSVNNRPSATFCPRNGDVVSSLYTVIPAGPPDDACAPKDGIYILGFFSAAGDTDEFDQHVIAHEAGHYFEDQFSRSDSIGGEHSLSDKLDLRVAFGEGWGDAFGAMALNDPVYRDSNLGANQDSWVNLESVQFAPATGTPGWFSEVSAFKFLWDLFDGANESNDSVALGFTPIYNVMTGVQPATDSLTSVFSFARALKAANPASATGINALLVEHSIVSSVDDFGSTETNAGGSADALPLYTDIQLNGGTQQVCGNTAFGFYNKLANRRFLRLVLTQQATVSVTATGITGAVATPVPDPDIYVWRRGQVVGFGNGVGSQEVLSGLVLAAGTYVIEVFEFSHTDSAEPQRGRTCINVGVSG